MGKWTKKIAKPLLGDLQTVLAQGHQSYNLSVRPYALPCDL